MVIDSISGNMPIDKIQTVAENFKRGSKSYEYWAKDPTCSDSNPSVHITVKPDGTVMIKAHNGTPTEAIVKAWGLEMRDLFPPRNKPPDRQQKQDKPQTVAVYDYKGVDGNLVFQVVRQRYPDGRKTFYQRRPDGHDGWINNMQGVDPVPYCLPQIIKTIEEGHMVVVCEGEKDCDRLVKLGFTATTNHGGAGKWREAHSKHFPSGSKVTIVPDNDLPGKKHAQEVAEQLKERGCQVRILELPGLPQKGDVSDWLDSEHTKEELLELLVKAWEQADVSSGSEGATSGKSLKITCLEDVEIEDINWIWHMFLAARKLTILEGDPGEGKTFVALAITAIITNGWPFPDEDGVPRSEKAREPGNVVYLTAEDGLSDTIKPRLAMLGADHKRVFILEGYFSPEDPDNLQMVTLTDLSVLRDTFEKIKPVLLIVDPLQAYLGAGVDMHRANEVRPVLSGIMRLAEEYDTAVIFIRHLNKSSGGKALYRGMGTIDFNAAARSVILIGRDPEDRSKRIIIQTKSSLSEEAPAIGFRLDKDGFAWLGKTNKTADEILNPQPKEKANNEDANLVDKVTAYLMEALRDGPVMVNRLYRDAARTCGASEKTVRRAKDKLNADRTIIGAFKGTGPQSPWYWQLQGGQPDHVGHVIQTSDASPLNKGGQDGQSELFNGAVHVQNHPWESLGQEIDLAARERGGS